MPIVIIIKLCTRRYPTAEVLIGVARALLQTILVDVIGHTSVPFL